MNIVVKGHSGCQIDVVNEGNEIYVYKSTADPKYIKRLVLQAEKQRAAAEIEHQHIRVPKIYDIEKTDETVVVKMQYVYSKNFIEFFEQAGFEQVDYLIGALEYFVEHEISKSKLQTVSSKIFQDKFAEIKCKCEHNPLYQDDERIASILSRSEQVFTNLKDMLIPVGLCHGDLTFSNILFNGNNYYLIDFLDSFLGTPLQDIVKLRQDTRYRWSQLMYTKRYDAVRLHIVLDKIDREIDTYFSNKYEWYRTNYPVMQLMNILRILPYAHEEKIVEFLKDALEKELDGMNGSSKGVAVQEISRLGLNEALNCPSDIEPLEQLQTLNRTILVPVAADKPEYENGLPYVFGLDKDGIIICIKSIMGLNLQQFDNIYFTVLRKYDERFFVGDSLRLQFKRLGITNAKVVVLDEPTQDQAETIYRTIMQEQVQGNIFIKDADCFFRTDFIGENAVALYPIEQLEVLSPKDKSYAAVDDMYYLTNIIEKTVVGHYISAGGYAIDNVDTFLHYYHLLRQYGRFYLSHIIYAMLLDKKTFRPMMVEEYKDWGTKKDLNRYE